MRSACIGCLKALMPVASAFTCRPALHLKQLNSHKMQRWQRQDCNSSGALPFDVDSLLIGCAAAQHMALTRLVVLGIHDHPC
jgi:hypothetical protein